MLHALGRGATRLVVSIDERSGLDVRATATGETGATAAGIARAAEAYLRLKPKAQGGATPAEAPKGKEQPQGRLLQELGRTARVEREGTEVRFRATAEATIANLASLLGLTAE